MLEKKAKTAVPIHELLARRWSSRAFDPQKIVSNEQIHALIEAARWAPSCYGDQPWRYIICDRATNPTAWKKACTCLAAGNQSWAKNAPLLFITIADSLFSRNGETNRWGTYDTGAASENLSLQATAMGLCAHQMGGFDAAQLQTTFSIPKQYILLSIIAIGHPLDAAKIGDDIKEKEYASRDRRQLEYNFYEGDWGVAFRRR